jgi:iron complex transport system substrate-binding protein
LRTDPRFAGIDAVKHDRFVTVTFSDATPGIRNIGAVRKVAKALYPHKFGSDQVPYSATR